MATTRVMTTVLPYSFDSDSTFHASVLFSHRLSGSEKLSDYPAMVNWVKSVRAAKFTLHTDVLDPVRCEPQLDVTDENVWKKAFPADSTTVRAFPNPDVTQNDWKSYPAHRTPDHAFDAHNASACASPVSRPAVSTAPLATELLATFGDIEGLRELIAALRNYRSHRDRILTNLEDARTRTVQAALSPTKPDPDTGDPGGGGPHVGPGGGGPHLEPEGNDTETTLPASPIDLLLSAKNVDSRITSYVGQLNDSTANTPIKKMLRDVQASVDYYHRPEEQPQDPDDSDNLAAAATPPRTPHPDPDFHERAAAACNVKTLARVLGLVVDLKVHEEDLTKLATANKIWCEVEIDGTERYVSPVTLCTASGTQLLAKPREPERWAGGRLRLGDDDRYRVLDLDPDAGGMSVEQLLRSALRALAIEANGDGGSFAPPSVRATGFAVAEIGRPNRLKEQLDKSPKGEPALAQSGQPGPELNFENLLRGTRLEVWDDFTKIWHSVHERSITALFGKTEIFKANDDVGHLQNPPLSQVPGDAANRPFYVHEVLAGWDGWSLSAPRPGKLVIHNPSDHEEPGQERVTSTPEATKNPGLGVQSTAKRGSLPALRYGTRYSFRIAGVDLAGNSVPMDMDLPPEVTASQIQAATTYLDAVRAKTSARDNASVTADLRKRGKLQAPTLGTGSGVRAEAERAMASVMETASSVRTRPELDTAPEDLARLIADADDAATITVPKPFLRWDPITAPTFVPRKAYVTGESLQRMVIRTGLTSAPGVTERHIVPPKGSELEAEQDGRLDQLMKKGKVAQAYAIALKERGSLFYKEVQDIDNPKGTIIQPGIKLLSMPNVTDGKTLEQIQDPEVQPAAGQYIVHDVDNLLVPYLPDPMVDGVALVFYEAGADHKFTNPRVLQSVTLKYAGAWPLLQPLRLVLHSAPRLDAEQVDNVIHVGLPPGEQVGVKVSSTLDDAHLNKMGLWVTSPINDPNVPEADREVLASAARDGWLWWLTPDEDLRLVHATARPAVAPKISRLSAKPRTANVVNANLDGVLDVHGASTDKIELRAEWTEPVDDPNAPEPASRTTREVVVKHSIKEDERFSVLTFNPNVAKHVGARDAEVPLRRAVHTLPDTKARKVTYQLHGSSRYREFFVPDELPKPDDAESLGNKVEVNIPSSAIPAPPVVHDVLPMFLWEQTTEPEHPFAIRRSRRSGVRIWLDRPWYSSGDGELLAIIATGDPALAKDKTDSVSLWARDPTLVSSKIANSYEVPVLTAWQQRAVQLNLTPESLPARPQLHVVKTGSPTTGDKVINAYAYIPEYDTDRRRWFVDAVFESAGANWPFLRLSVARYQPNSIAGMEFSHVVATDFIQLPPERIGTLSRPDKDHVRITITGVTSATNAPGLTLPDPRPDKPETLAPLVAKSHRVVATLQARSKASGSDLEWKSGAAVPCELAGVDAATFKATWTAELSLEPPEHLLTPGSSDDLRVQIEEYEILSADETPGTPGLTPVERLVYADHFYL
ncbi:hypothetical protein BVU76_26575 [Mycolicibacterium porcinum]|nr:hypothetical protein BVU76_26575 [Mycolicibacterium porcinum]